MRIKNKTERRAMAISQIILLVVSVAALSHVFGEIHVVSAQGQQCVKDTSTTISSITDEKGFQNDFCLSAFAQTREMCEGGSGKRTVKSEFREQCPVGADFTGGLTSPPSLPLPSPVGVKFGFPGLTGGDSALTGVSQFCRNNYPEGCSQQEVDKILEQFSGDEEAAAQAVTGGATGATGLKAFLGKARIGDLSIGGLLETAGWAAAIYVGTRLVLGQLGASPEFTSAFSTASAVGFLAGSLSEKIFTSALGGGLIGLGVGIVVFFATFKDTRYEVVSFSCYPWDAPIGGEHCGECNNEDFPCTEYRCRTLGQACELINQGTNEELCVWVNQGDVEPPVIQAWEETLTPDYKYIPDNAISPPDRGVQIVRDSGECVAPFTPLRFGVTLDEPGRCKIDPVNQRNFEDMNIFFGGSSTSKFNHSQTMNLPSQDSLAAENITLQNGGQFALYARCEDANGNSNVANFVFSFCVDDAQDTTAPLVVKTSILNGNPIAFNQTSVDLTVFVNEPADCRWSKTDQSYDNMENQMSCNQNVVESNAEGLYECSTTLTGLKDREDNDFYFRCEDQPHLAGTEEESQRNKNTQSHKFTLVGTRPLVISSIEPNGTIKDSTDPIKVTLEVETLAGHDEGRATCSFSDTGNAGDFVEFFETDSHTHSQDLFLAEGDYTYNVQCVDLGGNSDTATTSFTVETDEAEPSVVRVFHQETSLKVITNEAASCVYGNFGCGYPFEEGTKMSSLDDKEHSTAWDPDKSFYIKCADEFGNQPLDSNSCSIIVKPFEV